MRLQSTATGTWTRVELSRCAIPCTRPGFNGRNRTCSQYEADTIALPRFDKPISIVLDSPHITLIGHIRKEEDRRALTPEQLAVISVESSLPVLSAAVSFKIMRGNHRAWGLNLLLDHLDKQPAAAQRWAARFPAEPHPQRIWIAHVYQASLTQDAAALRYATSVDNYVRYSTLPWNTQMLATSEHCCTGPVFDRQAPQFAMKCGYTDAIKSTSFWKACVASSYKVKIGNARMPVAVFRVDAGRDVNLLLDQILLYPCIGRQEWPDAWLRVSEYGLHGVRLRLGSQMKLTIGPSCTNTF